MPRKKRGNWEDPLATVVLGVLLIAAFAARHDWRFVAVLVGADLVVFGGYLGFGHPHRCREPLVSRPGRCRNKAFGLLFGCRGVHHDYRLRRLIGSADDPREATRFETEPGARRRPSAVRAANSPPAGGPVLETRVTFWCTLVSTVSGVLSLVVGIIAL